MMRTLPTILGGLLLLPAVLGGQSAASLPATAPADTVTMRMIGAMQKQDYSAAATYFDPVETNEFMEAFRPLTSNPDAAATFAQALGLPDAAALGSATPIELLGRFLAVAAKTNPEMFEALSTAKYAIIGQATEGTTQTHVILRATLTMRGHEMSAAELRSLVKRDVGWRIQLPVEMRGMMIGLRVAAAQSQAPAIEQQ
jgi:hypothetical protein